MLLFATASAPESVGGSLAALAVYDILRATLPGVLAATGDPLGILFRTYAHTTGTGIPIDPQPLAGVTILKAIADAPAWGIDHRTPALVFDATGDLRYDVRRWPNQLAQLLADHVKTVIFILANDSPGARDWLDNLATNHPAVYAATIVLSYPIGAGVGHHAPERRTVAAPILHRTGLARLNTTGIAPSVLTTWNGPDRSPTDSQRIAQWLDAWRTILHPFLSRPTMLAPEGSLP
jgi:hypothetical protein